MSQIRPTAILCVSAVLLAGSVLAPNPSAADTDALNALADRASCLVVESESVELTSSVTGTLSSVYVEEGDAVVSGQTVAQLEASVEAATAAAAMARAQSDVTLRAREREREAAQSVLSRQEELVRRNAAPATAVEEARTELALVELAVEEARFNQTVARLEWERAQAIVDRRTVTSPINGVVTRVDLSAGENVDGSNPILTISTIDPLRIDVFLPLDAFPLIEVGMPITVAPMEPIGGSYETIVATRSPIVDAASGLFRVTLELPNPDNSVPAGIRCLIAF